MKEVSGLNYRAFLCLIFLQLNKIKVGRNRVDKQTDRQRERQSERERERDSQRERERGE